MPQLMQRIYDKSIKINLKVPKLARYNCEKARTLVPHLDKFLNSDRIELKELNSIFLIRGMTAMK